eukprot:sb/3479462/
MQTQKVNSDVMTAMALTGQRFSTMKQFFEVIRAPTVSRSSYDELMKLAVYPEIKLSFLKDRSKRIKRLNAKKAKAKANVDLADFKIIVQADAQFDSPGFSAKYCTYSLMSQDNHILAVIVKQKGEVDGALETPAGIAAIEDVEKAGLELDGVVSDRCPQMAKFMAEERGNLEHHHDSWHVIKNVKAKLPAKGLQKWTESIDGHIWHCLNTCEDDEKKLMGLLHSNFLHVLNIHNFKTAKAKKVWAKICAMKVGNTLNAKTYGELHPNVDPLSLEKCYHAPFTRGQKRKTACFDISDTKFKSYVDILANPQTVAALKKCKSFFHTGRLESFHSSKLLLLPKLNHYQNETMEVFGKLAAIRNNENVDGENIKRQYVVINYSRRTKTYSKKIRTEYDPVPHLRDIFDRVGVRLINGKAPLRARMGKKKKNKPERFHKQDVPDDVEFRTRGFRTQDARRR